MSTLAHSHRTVDQTTGGGQSSITDSKGMHVLVFHCLSGKFFL